MRQLTVSFGKRWNRRLKTAYLYYLREKKEKFLTRRERDEKMLLTFVEQSQYCDCDGG